jgi:DNA-binding transcriptional MerR regulator
MRTDVPARMLRYYEEQGLITPHRLLNGYREYDKYLVDRVRKIRSFLDAGVTTRIIGDILLCLNQRPQIVVTAPDPELRARFIEQRDKKSERLTFFAAEPRRPSLVHRGYASPAVIRRSIEANRTKMHAAARAVMEAD